MPEGSLGAAGNTDGRAGGANAQTASGAPPGRQLGRALSHDVDVIDLATATPILTWEELTTGRLVFEGDAVRVEEFTRRARFAAEDAEQRERMVLLAQIDDAGAIR